MAILKITWLSTLKDCHSNRTKPPNKIGIIVINPLYNAMTLVTFPFLKANWRPPVEPKAVNKKPAIYRIST